MHHLADPGPQLWQIAEQGTLDLEPLRRDGGDLRMHLGVHLVAPPPLGIGALESATLSSSGIMRSDFT